MKVIKAKTAGFCFGVKRAVDTVYEQLDSCSDKIYTYGPIIHNEEVVKDMESKGVVVLRSEEELDRLYELERQARKESLQYIENCCGDIYKLSFHFMEILAKYIPVEKDKPDEPSKQEKQQDAPKEQSEYFDAELLSLIHKVCVGEQFEDIATQDFYANINLSSCKKELKIKAREKIRVCYLIFLMSERLPKQDRDKWKNIILKQLDIDENYYKSKYKEPVSDFPSDSNQKFAKEMDAIFR